MKSFIQFLLPIALAIILPILNLFANNVHISEVDFYTKWIAGAVSLFLLWYLLIFASKIAKKTNTFYWILSIALSVGLLYILASFTIFKDSSLSKVFFIIKLTSASLLFTLIQYALQANDKFTQALLEKKQLENENYKIQLHELRIKVDPHFLYNSLNTLRSMIRKKNPESENFVMNLSNFYRQTLNLERASMTKLSKEIETVKSYFFLMQNRIEDGLVISYEIDEQQLDTKLPALSLQIVAENCLKHNRYSASEPLKIEISTHTDGYITIRNDRQAKLSSAESTGYGLNSIQRRYDLLKVKDAVKITASEEVYEVQLKLVN